MSDSISETSEETYHMMQMFDGENFDELDECKLHCQKFPLHLIIFTACNVYGSCESVY